MTTHWPLGRGSHVRSAVHLAVAGGVGALALLIGMGMAIQEPGSHAAPFAASVRTWALVMFAAVTLEAAVLLAFRPGVLRLLLPTPLGTERLFGLVDPTRSLALQALPYLAAAFAGLARREELGPGWSVVWTLYAAMLLRALLAPLALLAVALRKVLLPAGHWIVWGAAIATVIGLFGEIGSRWADAFLFAFPVHRWLWIALGIALVPVGSLVRLACVRVARRLLIRDELMAYAFPVEREGAARRRKTLSDRFCRRGRRLKRVIYLLEESLGLYRLSDILKGRLVWFTTFVALLYLMRNVGGSAAQMFVALGSLGAFYLYCMLRRVRLLGNRLVMNPIESALPVGHLERFAVQAFVFTAAWFAVGVLAAVGVWLVSTPPPPGGEVDALVPDVGVVRATAVNLVQVCAVLIAFYALCSGARAERNGARREPAWFRLLVAAVQVPLLLGLGFSALMSFVLLCRESGTWSPLLAPGLQFQSFLALAIYSLHTGDPNAAFLLGETFGLDGVAVTWRFDLLAWLLPALVLAYFLLVLVRTARGRAHPSYRLPLAHLPEWATRDLGARKIS